MTYSAEVLADSPLAYYRLGEASGTTLVDSSGNARNGTYSGTPTFGTAGLLTGDTDTCVDFSGDDYATVTSATWMNTPSTLTVEAWVVPDTITGDRIIASRTDWGLGPSSSTRGWHLIIQGGQFNVGLRMTDSTYHDAKVGPTLTVGTKYHVALVWDTAVGWVLYINGASAASSAALVGKSLGNPGNALRISRENYGVGFFDGRIDEVAIYGTALSASRIAAHYTAGTSSAPPAATVDLSLAGVLPAVVGSLTLAVRVGTATANRINGRRREGIGYVSDVTPVAPLPAGLARAQKVGKAFAYPTPTLVDGRPT